MISCKRCCAITNTLLKNEFIDLKNGLLKIFFLISALFILENALKSPKDIL